MATTDIELPRSDRRAARDLVALLFLLIGTVGVVTCAFRFDPLAGWAALSTVAIIIGVILGIDG